MVRKTVEEHEELQRKHSTMKSFFNIEVCSGLFPGSVVLLAGILLLGSCSNRAGEPGAGGYITAKVEKGPLEITVTGAGDIRSKDSNKIIPQIKSSSMITFLVPDGSKVEKNEVVARLNTDDIDRKIKEMKSQISDAESKLNSAETDLEIQVMDNSTALKKAEQNLEKTRLELEKFEKGDEPLDVRNAELKVTNAESDLVRKKNRLRELTALLDEGFVTQDEVDEQKTAVETAEVALETAKIEKSLLHEYTIPLNRENYKSAVVAARTELEKTVKQNEARLENKKQLVEMARQALDRNRTDLKLNKEERDACKILAPVSGVVMYGNPDRPWRRGDIEVGATIHRGQVMMTIPDMSELEVVVSVHEADVRKVKQGQKARITVDAISQKMFEGEVTQVAQVASSEGWLPSDVKEFNVKLSISGGNGDLKPGFSCSAEIVTANIESTLYLPVAAVFRKNDNYCVYPAAGKGRVHKDVTIGQSSVGYVEVLSGVEEGAKVLLSLPDTEEEREE